MQGLSSSIVLLMLAMTGPNAYAEIFVCKDQKNHVTYQQKPCTTQTLRTLKRAPEVPLEEQMKARERTEKANASYEAYAAKTEIERLEQEKMALQNENRALEKRAAALEEQVNAPRAVFINPFPFGNRPNGLRNNLPRQNFPYQQNRIYNNDAFRLRFQNGSQPPAQTNRPQNNQPINSPRINNKQSR